MNKKALSNTFWFLIALFTIMLVGIGWVTTAEDPVEYVMQTGRQQSIIFNGYIAAEQIRNYAEESAKLATFYTLDKLNISKTKNNCFDDTDFASVEFSRIYKQAMYNYMSVYPLENKYSDLLPHEYGEFNWGKPPALSVGEDQDSLSALMPRAGDTELRIRGSPMGDIQILNSRYLFLYSARGEVDLVVTCDEYEKYMDYVAGLSF